MHSGINITGAEAGFIETALISDEDTLVFTWVVYAVVCQAIDVFGIATNIINIVCFVRQGFKEPVNITLLGLAASDLGCLLTLAWINVSLTPAVLTADLSFEVMEVVYLTGAMPHLIFTRLTSWITAIITLERCMCIIAPLKVKHLITPKRVFAIVLSTFIIHISSGTPAYIVNDLGMKFSPRRNKTIIGLISTTERVKVEKISFAINSFFMPFAAFIIITVCTATLVISLHRRTAWRKTTVSQDDVSSRNTKVAKMVVMISTLFISCFIPVTVIMLALAFEPGLTINGKYVNVGTVVGGAGVLLESINSSANIFIYYHMSSKYRHAFHSIFFYTKHAEETKTKVSLKY